MPRKGSASRVVRNIHIIVDGLDIVVRLDRSENLANRCALHRELASIRHRMAHEETVAPRHSEETSDPSLDLYELADHELLDALMQ